MLESAMIYDIAKIKKREEGASRTLFFFPLTSVDLYGTHLIRTSVEMAAEKSTGRQFPSY